MNIRKTLAAAMLGAAVLWSLPCALNAQSAANQQTTEVDSLLVSKTPEQKRLIDRFEIFIGPSLSFNYGNKFLQNYSDENISNRRMAKPGYSFGLGVYHSFNDRIDLNARLQYDQKGVITEFENFHVSWYNDHSYNYLTFALAPVVYLGNERRFFISGGGYLSRILDLNSFVRRVDSEGDLLFEQSRTSRTWKAIREDGGIHSVWEIPGTTSFHSYDFGLVLSVGYNIPIKNDLLTIQLIDNLGLTNINRYTPYGQREKNHSIQLLLGYSFLR